MTANGSTLNRKSFPSASPDVWRDFNGRLSGTQSMERLSGLDTERQPNLIYCTATGSFVKQRQAAFLRSASLSGSQSSLNNLRSSRSSLRSPAKTNVNNNLDNDNDNYRKDNESITGSGLKRSASMNLPRIPSKLLRERRLLPVPLSPRANRHSDVINGGVGGRGDDNVIMINGEEGGDVSRKTERQGSREAQRSSWSPSSSSGHPAEGWSSPVERGQGVEMRSQTPLSPGGAAQAQRHSQARSGSSETTPYSFSKARPSSLRVERGVSSILSTSPSDRSDRPSSRHSSASLQKNTSMDGSVPSGKQPSGKQPSGKQPSGIQSSGKQPSGKQPSGKQPSGKQPSGIQSSGKQPSGKQPSDKQPSGKQPSGKQPSGIQPSGKQPSGIQPSGKQPSGKQPSGKQPSGKMPSETYVVSSSEKPKPFSVYKERSAETSIDKAKRAPAASTARSTLRTGRKNKADSNHTATIPPPVLHFPPPPEYPPSLSPTLQPTRVSAATSPMSPGTRSPLQSMSTKSVPGNTVSSTSTEAVLGFLDNTLESFSPAPATLDLDGLSTGMKRERPQNGTSSFLFSTNSSKPVKQKLPSETSFNANEPGPVSSTPGSVHVEDKSTDSQKLAVMDVTSADSDVARLHAQKKKGSKSKKKKKKNSMEVTKYEGSVKTVRRQIKPGHVEELREIFKRQEEEEELLVLRRTKRRARTSDDGDSTDDSGSGYTTTSDNEYDLLDAERMNSLNSSVTKIDRSHLSPTSSLPASRLLSDDETHNHETRSLSKHKSLGNSKDHDQVSTLEKKVPEDSIYEQSFQDHEDSLGAENVSGFSVPTFTSGRLEHIRVHSIPIASDMKNFADSLPSLDLQQAEDKPQRQLESFRSREPENKRGEFNAMMRGKSTQKTKLGSCTGVAQTSSSGSYSEKEEGTKCNNRDADTPPAVISLTDSNPPSLFETYSERSRPTPQGLLVTAGSLSRDSNPIHFDDDSNNVASDHHQRPPSPPFDSRPMMDDSPAAARVSLSVKAAEKGREGEKEAEGGHSYCDAREENVDLWPDNCHNDDKETGREEGRGQGWFPINAVGVERETATELFSSIASRPEVCDVHSISGGQRKEDGSTPHHRNSAHSHETQLHTLVVPETKKVAHRESSSNVASPPVSAETKVSSVDPEDFLSILDNIHLETEASFNSETAVRARQLYANDFSGSSRNSVELTASEMADMEKSETEEKHKDTLSEAACGLERHVDVNTDSGRQGSLTTTEPLLTDTQLVVLTRSLSESADNIQSEQNTAGTTEIKVDNTEEMAASVGQLTDFTEQQAQQDFQPGPIPSSSASTLSSSRGLENNVHAYVHLDPMNFSHARQDQSDQASTTTHMDTTTLSIDDSASGVESFHFQGPSFFNDSAEMNVGPVAKGSITADPSAARDVSTGGYVGSVEQLRGESSVSMEDDRNDLPQSSVDESPKVDLLAGNVGETQSPKVDLLAVNVGERQSPKVDLLAGNVGERQSPNGDLLAGNVGERQSPNGDLLAGNVGERQSPKVDLLAGNIGETQSPKVDILAGNVGDTQSPKVDLLAGNVGKRQSSVSLLTKADKEARGSLLTGGNEPDKDSTLLKAGRASSGPRMTSSQVLYREDPAPKQERVTRKERDARLTSHRQHPVSAGPRQAREELSTREVKPDVQRSTPPRKAARVLPVPPARLHTAISPSTDIAPTVPDTPLTSHTTLTLQTHAPDIINASPLAPPTHRLETPLVSQTMLSWDKTTTDTKTSTLSLDLKSESTHSPETPLVSQITISSDKNTFDLKSESTPSPKSHVEDSTYNPQASLSSDKNTPDSSSSPLSLDLKSESTHSSTTHAENRTYTSPAELDTRSFTITNNIDQVTEEKNPRRSSSASYTSQTSLHVRPPASVTDSDHGQSAKASGGPGTIRVRKSSESSVTTDDGDGDGTQYRVTNLTRDDSDKLTTSRRADKGVKSSREALGHDADVESQNPLTIKRSSSRPPVLDLSINSSVSRDDNNNNNNKHNTSLHCNTSFGDNDSQYGSQTSKATSVGDVSPTSEQLYRIVQPGTSPSPTSPTLPAGPPTPHQRDVYLTRNPTAAEYHHHQRVPTRPQGVVRQNSDSDSTAPAWRLARFSQSDPDLSGSLFSKSLTTVPRRDDTDSTRYKVARTDHSGNKLRSSSSDSDEDSGVEGGRRGTYRAVAGVELLGTKPRSGPPCSLPRSPSPPPPCQYRVSSVERQSSWEQRQEASYDVGNNLYRVGSVASSEDLPARGGRKVGQGENHNVDRLKRRSWSTVQGIQGREENNNRPFRVVRTLPAHRASMTDEGGDFIGPGIKGHRTTSVPTPRPFEAGVSHGPGDVTPPSHRPSSPTVDQRHSPVVVGQEDNIPVASSQPRAEDEQQGEVGADVSEQVQTGRDTGVESAATRAHSQSLSNTDGDKFKVVGVKDSDGECAPIMNGTNQGLGVLFSPHNLSFSETDGGEKFRVVTVKPSEEYHGRTGSDTDSVSSERGARDHTLPSPVSGTDHDSSMAGRSGGRVHGATTPTVRQRRPPSPAYDNSPSSPHITSYIVSNPPPFSHPHTQEEERVTLREIKPRVSSRPPQPRHKSFTEERRYTNTVDSNRNIAGDMHDNTDTMSPLQQQHQSKNYVIFNSVDNVRDVSHDVPYSRPPLQRSSSHHLSPSERQFKVVAPTSTATLFSDDFPDRSYRGSRPDAVPSSTSNRDRYPRDFGAIASNRETYPSSLMTSNRDRYSGEFTSALRETYPREFASHRNTYPTDFGSTTSNREPYQSNFLSTVPNRETYPGDFAPDVSSRQTLPVFLDNATTNDDDELAMFRREVYEEKTLEIVQETTTTHVMPEIDPTIEEKDLRVLRGKILIQNRIQDESRDEDDFLDNMNVFDTSFHLGKDNPLYQSDPDIYKTLEAELRAEEERSRAIEQEVTQDVTWETVERVAQQHKAAAEEEARSQAKPRPKKKKQNLSSLLLSKLASIDSKDIHQTIHVDHRHEDIYGDVRLVHADGSTSDTPNPSSSSNFDSVHETVELELRQGKALVIIKVIAERIVPIDVEFNVWRKTQAIVTRNIEVDLLATEQRRRLYERVMQTGGRVEEEEEEEEDFEERLGGGPRAGPGYMAGAGRPVLDGAATLRSSRRAGEAGEERQLSSLETLRLFSQIIGVAAGEGEGEGEGERLGVDVGSGDRDRRRGPERGSLQGPAAPSAMDLLF